MGLADDWRELLHEKPALEYVKGYEAFGFRGQLRDWSIEERDKRLLKFVALIAKYSGKGIAFVIDNKPFDSIKGLKDDDGNSFKDPAEFAYSASLATLLQVLPDFGEKVIDVVFDRDLITRKQADRAYQNIFTIWPNDLTSRLLRKEPHWEDDKDFLPLQAADLLAYCVRASRDLTDERHGPALRSPVLSALRAIPTALAYVSEKQIQHLRDRKEKGIERRQIFTMTKW